MVDEPKHILALVPNWLGDVAMCTPALRALRTRYPGAELTVAGRDGACALLKDFPGIQRLHPIPARPGILTQRHLASELRPYARDLAVVFPHSIRAALLARLAGARRVLGYRRGNRSWLLTDRVEPYRENGAITPIYMAREYLDLLAPLECTDDAQGLSLGVSDADREAVRAQLPEGQPLVGLAPGAAFGPSKRWPEERFAGVADALHEEIGAACVLLTGPGEDDTRDKILAAAKYPLVEPNRENGSVGKLKASIEALDLLVCNDSGPRHIAVAFDVPTLCIMGPTAPAYSCGPYERGEVLRIDVDCGPCQKPTCHTDHRCMTGIDVAWAAGTARKILAVQS